MHNYVKWDNSAQIGSVSVRIPKEDVHLHPDLEFWTWLIENGDHTKNLYV